MFVIGGVGLAVSMVILLPVLGQGFQSLAQLPFKNLDADLVVQQSKTESALPETMGLMIPYSAQPIAEKMEYLPIGPRINEPQKSLIGP